MLKTSNYNLNKLETNDIVDFDVLNENADILDAELKKVSDKANYIQIATGSATAITLDNVTLANGFTVTFVVAANNNGAATKINGKNLYKPGGTAAPKLIAGRAVTVWYNGTNFFIKASASGNATADKVLAPYTISTDEDIDIVGTMIDNGPESAEITNLTSQNQEYIITKGFHSGLRKIKAVISGLAANVIKAGTPVGGIVGTFTSDATAVAGDILSGKTGYVNGNKVTGNILVYTGGRFGGANSDAFTDSPINKYEYNQYVGALDFPLSGYYNGNFGLHVPNLLAANIKANVKVGSQNGYVNGTFTSDATAVAGNLLYGTSAYVKGNKVTGNIPVVNPDYSDQITATDVSVGDYSGDGKRYVYINHGLNGKYCNGANWVRSYQPYLRPEYIVPGASIMGIQGAAAVGKKTQSGTVTSSASMITFVDGNNTNVITYYITVSGLTFTPSLIVCFRLAAGAYAVIYNAGGVGITGNNSKIAIANYSYGYGSPQLQSGAFMLSVNAWVTSTGFQLPVINAGAPFSWIAYE